MKNITNQEKLLSLSESIKVDQHLIKHYTHILDHFDKIDGQLQKEIDDINLKREELLNKFIEAPEKLIQLKNHLTELTAKSNDIKGGEKTKKNNLKKFKILKLRLQKMEQELIEAGYSRQTIKEILNSL